MKRDLDEQKGAIELVENGFHLLRATPLATFACYYVGGLPFVLGFLYFWSDMSGGVLAVETPNPESLAIFATHFYLDPTHTRPIPPALLTFYVEEAGFGQIEVRRFAPAAESMPEVNTLPAEFREKVFGALDYAVIARRLG